MAPAAGMTITELVASARASGYQITERTIRDWTARGLIDHPQRRALGRGKGSAQALYDYNQQQLLLALLHHRSSNDVPNLARIPLALWAYFGDDYVNTHHARRALATWLGDARSSLKTAKLSATRVLEQLDHPAATPDARRELRDLLTDIAYTGRQEQTRLITAVRAVYEPDSDKIARAIGHPAAPITTEAVVGLIEARLTAARLIKTNQYTDADLVQARDDLRVSVAEYAAQHSELAQAHPTLYEQPTFEVLANQVGGNLLTVLGLRRLHPDALIAPPARHVTINLPLR